MAETQAQVDFKKRARRRLIGAVVLAIGLIIALPMVMDKAPPSAPEQPVVVHVPNRPSFETSPPGMAVSTAPSEEVATGSNTVVPSELVEAPPDSAELAPGNPATKVTVIYPDSETAPAQAKQQGEASAETVAKAPETAKPTAKPALSTRDTADRARAEAILAGKSVPSAKTATVSSTAKGSRFAIQVVANNDPDNAKQNEDRISRLGFPVYREKAGSLIRVKVGPFATREAAEQALSKLKQEGFAPGGVIQY